MPDTSDTSSPFSGLIGSRMLQRNTREVLDHVEQVGEPIVILRRGRTMAALVPIGEEEAKMLLRAGSLSERRKEGGAGEQPQAELFAVAEREIVDEAVPADTAEGVVEDAAEGWALKIDEFIEGA